jgi:hypothetical protein
MDGVLIPVRLLVNDMSIVRADDFDFVAYWHVELEQHSIVLAEGTAAESYLEWNNKGGTISARCAFRFARGRGGRSEPSVAVAG